MSLVAWGNCRFLFFQASLPNFQRSSLEEHSRPSWVRLLLRLFGFMSGRIENCSGNIRAGFSGFIRKCIPNSEMGTMPRLIITLVVLSHVTHAPTSSSEQTVYLI